MSLKDLTSKLFANNTQAINNATQSVQGKAKEVTAKALIVTGVTNTVILLVLLLIFSLLRNKFPRVFTPRLLLNGYDSSIGTLPSSLFGWVIPSLKLEDETILRLLGLDALMFLRVLRLCFVFSLIILPYGFVVTIPANLYGGVSRTDPTVAGLDRLTMGNVVAKSDLLWTHFFGVWMYTILIFYFLYHECVAYQRFRQLSLSDGEKYPYRYLVMLQDIPKEVMSCFLHIILSCIITKYFVLRKT